MFDKPVYNQNCIGLTEKVFSHHGHDPGSRSLTSLSTRFETFPLDSDSALRYARNDKEESKEVRLFFTWAHLVGKGPQTTEVKSFYSFFMKNLRVSS